MELVANSVEVLLLLEVQDMLIVTSTKINKSKQQYVFFDKVGNPQFVESYTLSIICTFICAIFCFGVYIYNLI